MAEWVYEQTEPNLWTVGFYDPQGRWHPDSDHGSQQKAGDRVHYLNGGALPVDPNDECATHTCDYYSYYLVWYDPEQNGPKLEHEAYHFAAKRCSEAQDKIQKWMEMHDVDPLADPDGKFLWDQATKWEKKVAA
jgi:hypothetical protein